VSGLSSVRIDHNHVNPTTKSLRGLYFYGCTGCLADHNYIEESNGGIDVEGNDSRDGTFPGDYNWSHPITLGGSDPVFMEDNKFVYTNVQDGAYDLYNGARAVFRFNDVTGTTTGSHGLDSSAGRSTLQEENYKNTASASFYTYWNTRGGVYMVWGNTT